MTDRTSELRQDVQATWWIVLLQGIAALLLGFLLFGQPGATLVLLSVWLGIYWLTDGILLLTNAFMGAARETRAWLIVAGIISVVAGVLVVSRPLLVGALTTGFAVYLLAAAAIANGTFQLIAGRFSPVSAQRERSWVSVLIGALYIVGGLILLFHPAITAITLLNLISIWAIVVGAAYIFMAFRLRSL